MASACALLTNLPTAAGREPPWAEEWLQKQPSGRPRCSLPGSQRCSLEPLYVIFRKLGLGRAWPQDEEDNTQNAIRPF